MMVQARRRSLYDKKVAALTPRSDVAGSLRTDGKLLIPHFQEKQRVEHSSGSYRKPTQVGEEKILRRLREIE